MFWLSKQSLIAFQTTRTIVWYSAISGYNVSTLVYWPAGDGAHSTPQDSDRQVLDWKFSVIDKDNDNFLEKTEYRDLRRLVKKVVKPKRCAKTFTKLCDLDNDQRISREEWASCLGLDFNRE